MTPSQLHIKLVFYRLDKRYWKILEKLKIIQTKRKYYYEEISFLHDEVLSLIEAMNAPIRRLRDKLNSQLEEKLEYDYKYRIDKFNELQRISKSLEMTKNSLLRE